MNAVAKQTSSMHTLHTRIHDNTDLKFHIMYRFAQTFLLNTKKKTKKNLKTVCFLAHCTLKTSFKEVMDGFVLSKKNIKLHTVLTICNRHPLTYMQTLV